MANRLDIVIFGATGHTGKLLVKNAIHMCKDQNLKFAIAGRRKEALEAVVKEFASDNEDVPIILADATNEESLKKMTKRAKVLINCCGPYKFYGEPVVKACIATRTDYIDVTAEQQFMEQMQLKYNEAAKEAGVYIVSACGVVSILCDLGIIFTQQKFGGQVNAVEVYMKIWFTKCILPIIRQKGSYITYGTWNSGIQYMRNRNELQELHRKLYANAELPELTPKLKSRGILHRSDASEGWSISVPTADRAVACRTQHFLYNKYKDRPAQVQYYVTFKYFYELLMIIIGSMVLLIMSRISCGRNLLLKHPALFTAGFASRENPNMKNQKSICFDMTIVARGWTTKLAESTEHTDPPNKTIITKVSGESPYEMTSVVALLSAITILNETDKIPDNGGVFTPGAAFGKTSLIEKMIKHNIKFEVISTDVRNNIETI